MRTLCLWFPKLAIQLTRKARPELRKRPLLLISGHGDDALVAATAAEVCAAGVIPGMSAGQARGRCPGAVFLPDNAGACLDELERIAVILQVRATKRVAIEGRDALAIEIPAGLPPAGERLFGERAVSLARAWSGLDVRGGLADSARDALDSAHAARRELLIVPPADGAELETVQPFRPESIEVRVRVSGAGELASRAALGRLLRNADAVIAARGQSFRAATLYVDTGDATYEFPLAIPQPFHEASMLAPLLPRSSIALAEARSLTLALDRLGPDVRVRHSAAGPHRMAQPASHLQRAG